MKTKREINSRINHLKDAEWILKQFNDNDIYSIKLINSYIKLLEWVLEEGE